MTAVVKLNWGCGTVQPDGWMNSDRDDHGQHHVGDLLDGLPWPDETFDVIVANHSLQQIGYHDLPDALTELRRVLAVGGVLRILVPDLCRALVAYHDHERWLADLINDDTQPTWDGKLCTYLLWYSTARSVFTADWLVELCRNAGFAFVAPVPSGWTNSKHSDATALDDRQPESLIVEAIR